MRSIATPAAPTPVIIIGAGPTGLSAAYHLGADALLLEQADRVGGWCRSLEVGGFTFDYAGHIMFSNDAYVHKLYRMLLGDNVHWQDREAWIYSQGVYTRHPFHAALHGLPPEVVKECLLGLIEARYGAAPRVSTLPHAADVDHGVSSGRFQRRGPLPEREAEHAAPCDCCGDGILESTVPRGEGNGHPVAPGRATNFLEFIYQTWGAGVARHFAVPYNMKFWGVPLDELDTSWLGGRVPLPDLEEVLDGALRPSPKPTGPDVRFGYPLRGGFQALMDGFLQHVRRQLRLDARVAAVSPVRRTVTLADGGELGYDCLISTMPLPALVHAIGDEAPAEVRRAAAGLRHISVRCVHLGVGREDLTEKHWIYYAEDTVFHRIFVQGNASPWCNPPGGFGLTCEITYSPDKPLPCEGRDLTARCVADCRRVGLLRADDPIRADAQVDLPHAYVVCDRRRRANVTAIRTWLKTQDILLAGRYGEWDSYNADHAFLAGRRAADRVRLLEKQRLATS